MYTILRSSVFAEWLNGLTDEQAKARILARILSAEKGNFGDCAPVGGGISEMRVHVGPGYRVYYVRRGGDKSAQQRDIRQAKAILTVFKE